MSSHQLTLCETPDEWFDRIKNTPGGINFEEVSWVDRFAAIAANTVGFWTQAAQALHAIDRHSDAYDAWQRAIGLESPTDAVNRLAMANAFFDRVEDEGDWGHYFADKALALYTDHGVWQMVAFIQHKREQVKPMLVALSKAYQHGEDWSQRYLDAPFDLEDWFEIEVAFQGEHLGLRSRYGSDYCEGLTLPARSESSSGD